MLKNIKALLRRSLETYRLMDEDLKLDDVLEEIQLELNRLASSGSSSCLVGHLMNKVPELRNELLLQKVIIVISEEWELDVKYKKAWSKWGMDWDNCKISWEE